MSHPSLRVPVVVLAVVLLTSACGPRQEIVYVDRREHSSRTNQTFEGSPQPRVHQDGHHEPAEGVGIEVGAAEHAAPSTPVAIAHGQPSAATAYWAPTSSPTPLASAHTAGPAVAVADASKPQTAARPEASPTAQARLSLNTTLGTAPGTPVPNRALDVAEANDELATVIGRIEGTDGSLLTVQTGAERARVRLTNGVRVERDALGSPADLKPGQFVGVLHPPTGGASSVRLYTAGPSMPRPGVIPMVGARLGQVTTFGSIVNLRFGGLVLNAGGQTETVALPNTVQILRPVPSSPTDLSVGTQVIATGPQAADGAVLASAVRVTGQQPRPTR